MRVLFTGLFLAVLALVGPARAASADPHTNECILEQAHLIEEAEAAGEEFIGDYEKCHEAPNPILPATDELIWGAISFTLLFLVMKRFAYPAIKKGMDARAERIQSDLDAAEGAKGQADEVLAEYRAQLADAKGEAGRIIEEARQQADALKKEQEQRLQGELAALRQKAAADVEAAKAQAIADLRTEVASIAIGAAEVVIQHSLDRETQTQLVEQYIASLASRSN